MNTSQHELRRVLEREARTTQDAPAIAAATRRLGERIAQHVMPLIGKSGVAAIFARALLVVERRFPWLAQVGETDRGADAFMRLQMVLEQREPAVAMDAAVAVLATINDLLNSFIGEGLTTRLMHTAWPGSGAITSTLKRGLKP